jgi:hypothetical protein
MIYMVRQKTHSVTQNWQNRIRVFIQFVHLTYNKHSSITEWIYLQQLGYFDLTLVPNNVSAGSNTQHIQQSKLLFIVWLWDRSKYNSNQQTNDNNKLGTWEMVSYDWPGTQIY